MSDLERAFKQATRGAIHNEGAAAVLGRADNETVYFTDSNGVLHKDRVWVRYMNGNVPTHEAAVRNGGVPAQVGLPIKIVTRNNVLVAIVDKYSGLAYQFTGGGGWFPIEPHAPTHYRLGTDPLYIDSLAFLPLLVRPSDPLAMTVYVEPGFYRYGGEWKVWQGGDTGSLAAYVPAVDDGTIHFLIIALDRSSNTLAIVDGGEVAGSGDILFPVDAVVTYADILAVSVASIYWPLAVVELSYGHTKIRPRDITYDLRLWGGDTPTTEEFIDRIMTDANGDIMVDANGNVMVSS
jgi:hypothetical protein